MAHFDPASFAASGNTLTLSGVTGYAQCDTFLKASLQMDGTSFDSPSILSQSEDGALVKASVPADESKALFDLAGKEVYLWLYPSKKAEEDGMVVIFKSTTAILKDHYALTPAAGVLNKEAFWNDSWIFLSNQDGLVMGDVFANACNVETNPQELKDLNTLIAGKQFGLSLGLNNIHHWDLRSALEGFDLGPLEALAGDTSLMLLGNEQESGMQFSILLQTLPKLPAFLNKIITFEWVSFDIFHSFLAEELQSSSAEFAAKGSFLGADARVGISFPTKANKENSLLTLSIDPYTPVNLSSGLANLLAIFDSNAPTLPEGFPTRSFALEGIDIGISSTGIESIEATLSLQAADKDEGWEILKDLFIFYGIRVTLHWKKGGSFDFDMEGSMNALSYDLFMSYSHPTQIVTASIFPGQTTKQKIADFATDLGLPTGLANGFADILTGVDLSMYADIQNQELEITLANHTDWSIGPVKIEHVELRLEFYNAWSFSGATLYTTIDLPIGQLTDVNDPKSKRKDVAIDLEAEYDKDSQFWSFSGQSENGEKIAVGDALDALAAKLGAGDHALPEAIRSLTMQDLEVSFDSNGNFSFGLTTTIVLDGGERDLIVHLKKEGPNWTVTGSMILGNGVAFDLGWAKKPDNTQNTADQYLVANLSLPLTLHTREILWQFAPDIADQAPIDLEVDLKGVLVAFHKGTGGSQFVFRVLFSMNLDFSGFPLIGKMLPTGIGFQDMQVLAASKSFADKDIDDLNGLLGDLNISPSFTKEQQQATHTPVVQRGFTLSGNICLGGPLRFPLFLNIGGGDPKPAPAKGKDGQELAPAQPVTTIAPADPKPDARSQGKLQKVLSAVHFEKVGLVFKNNQVGLTITGGLRLTAFELEFMGLEITVPADVFKDASQISKIHFGLSGLGLKIQKEPLTISAAFLRRTYDEGKPTQYDEYAGMVQLGFKALQISGLGAYANYQGHPSLFLFVYLGYPFGGPPAFFLTGLAGGFGVNRDFVPPTVDKVLDFPLLKCASPTAALAQASAGLPAIMDSLHTYLPPRVGEYFLAAGISFRSFGIVNTQAILAVKFGEELEIDLLGISSVILPAAFIELQFLVRFVPAEGYLMARGQLTSRSFLYAPVVHLTGGFAVGFWFGGGHEGDFVVSVGGYHPAFKVPKHYPTNIPRLGLNWQLSSEMGIKGGIYFALTPQAIMAGGFLEASYSSGALYAYLKITADFIIYWKPFHYDAQMSIEVGVRVTIDCWLFDIHIDVHITAGLHIWGPEFAGVAYLDVGVKTFEVSFGGGGGSNASPISWLEFKQAFLPPLKDDKGKLVANKYTPGSVAISGGLLKKTDFLLPDVFDANKQKITKAQELWLVNTKEMRLVTDSVIPANKQYFENISDLTKIDWTSLVNPGGTILAAGIAPMNKASVDVLHFINIKKHDGQAWVLCEKGHFKFTPILKNVPAALWGKEMPSKDIAKQADGVLANALSGFEIAPGKDPEGGFSHEMDKTQLAYNTDLYQQLYGFGAEGVFSKNNTSITNADLVAANSTRASIMDYFNDMTGIKSSDLDLTDLNGNNKAYQLLDLPELVGF